MKQIKIQTETIKDKRDFVHKAKDFITALIPMKSR